MSATISCRPLSLIPASLSRVSILHRPSLRLSLGRSSSHIGFQSRHENFSLEIHGSELIEDELSEDLVKPKGDQSKQLEKRLA